MSVARRLLLWASENQGIESRFRRSRVATHAVRRFMPGETIDEALAAAQTLGTAGISTVLTLLGEHVTVLDEAERTTRHYITGLDRITDAGLSTHLSVKLSQLGLDLDEEAAYRQLSSLVAEAKLRDNFVWVDMEGSDDTDVTLSVYEHVRREHENVGLCLQSYLRRTARDLDRLLPLRPVIRLVKGAYREPPAIAFPRKREVDGSYLALADRLLAAAAGGDAGPPGFATHDVPLLERIIRIAAERGVDPSGYEIQMLYGVGRNHQRRFAADGHAVRVLISYGTAWFPWYVRRLAERPANLWFVLRTAFTR